MRYDNLEIKDVIDRCVEGILQEDDKEFLSHTNWESEWIFLLARKIYEALLERAYRLSSPDILERLPP